MFLTASNHRAENVALVKWLIGSLLLVGILVIGIIKGIEPLSLEFVNPANASTAPDAILVGVNYESSKINSSGLAGLSHSGALTILDHSADNKRGKGNIRTLLPKDMLARNECYETNSVGSLSALQWAQDSVANVLQFDMTFDDFSVVISDVGNYVPQFDAPVRIGGSEALYFTNNESWSVTSDKFRLGGLDGFFGRAGQADSKATEYRGENCDECSRSGRDFVFVSMNEVSDWTEDRAYEGGKVFFICVGCFLLFFVAFYLVLEGGR
jgi:hypothetical protein